LKIAPNQLISLGYGKYVRSDDVVAVEPITHDRGPGRRALVYVRGVDSPLIASRSEDAIVEELTAPGDDAFHTRQQRAMLQQVVSTLDDIPGTLRRRLRDSDGVDLDGLAREANRLLA